MCRIDDGSDDYRYGSICGIVGAGVCIHDPDSARLIASASCNTLVAYCSAQPCLLLEPRI
jgi:hypothetical protein